MNPVFDVILIIFMGITTLIALLVLIALVLVILHIWSRDPDMEIRNDDLDEHAQDHEEARDR